MPKKNKKWTPQEDMIIHDYYLDPISRYGTNQISIASLVEKLAKYQPGKDRTQDAVRNRIYTLRRRYWMQRNLKRNEWMTGLRLGYLDIEVVGGFAANYGHMVSWAMFVPDNTYEWNMNFIDKQSNTYETTPIVPEDVTEHGKVYYDMWSRKDAINWKVFDKNVTASLVKALDDVDLVVTYYGTKFDVPYVRTRSLYHNIRFPKYQEKLHLDLYYTVRSLLKLGRNSLDQATRFFGIEGKNHVDAEMWMRARVGEEEGMEYVINHNIEDVKILAALHNRLGGYRQITRRSL
jgi:DNA polymerase elongation subunit (family B)